MEIRVSKVFVNVQLIIECFGITPKWGPTWWKFKQAPVGIQKNNVNGINSIRITGCHIRRYYRKRLIASW